MADAALAPPPPAAAPPPPPAAAPPANPWHHGMDAELIGHAQLKGWKLDDPKTAFEAAAKAYKGVENLVGRSPDELLRLPKPSAQPAEIDAFWQRLGAPKEAKDIDLSGVKTAAGNPIDPKLAEAITSTAISARVPKEAAVALAGAVSKHLDGLEAEATALRSGRLTEQVTALKQNWGSNYDANLMIAKTAFTKVAQAAGMDEAKAREAVDAMSRLGGVGAATAMEMWRVIGTRMGEDKMITMGGAGGQQIMTREAAKAEIGNLKVDKAFRQRLLDGSVVDRQRWDSLHAVAYGNAA